MFIVPDGRIVFSNDGMCQDVQVVNGVFITKVGFDVTGEQLVNSADKLTDTNASRCFLGKRRIQ